MDFRTLLQSMTSLSEAETKDTKTGRVHKGDYGTSYDGDDEKKPAASTEKRGRGRPKKGADDSGEVKSYDTKSLGSVFGGGQKPKKDVGTVSKKHSLKEYMESVEDTKEAEAVMEGMFSGVDHSNIAANLGKLAKVIKSVQTPEQFAVAQKYAQRMSGTIMNHQHDKLGFGSGIKANMGVMRAVQDDLMAKAKELGIPYNALEEAGEQVEIKPAQQNTQVIQQGNKTLGTVTNPQLANQIKQAIGQGQMSLSGDDEEQGMFEGKKPDFLDVDKDKNKKESFSKAVKDKEAKKKVSESISLSESPETLQHIISKYKHEVKRFINGDELDHDLYEALFDYYFNAGEMPYGTAKGRTGDPFEWITQRFEQDVHDHVVDESTARDFTQHATTSSTSDFTKPGSSMAQPRGTPTTINRPVSEPTPWSVDPVNAATDRAFNFIDSLKKKTPFSEGTDMKDIQLESWEQQLNGLLTEGITVSSSQGQQGAPDSVSVSATEGDADALLAVLRNAGIGGFGAEPQSPEIGYGVAQGGEEDFNGTGTQPQPSPDVVGDDSDMLSMLKKMAGLSGEGNAEVVAIGGDEEGQDYEDEQGSDETALQPADDGEEGSDEEAGSEESDEEEKTDEGNAFTGKLKQTPQGGEFKMGDKSYKDNSSLEEEGHDHDEETCNECGGAMYEGHACGEEQVEEAYANEPNDEIAQLKALLSMGNDMHREKRTQAMGNPVRVTMETKLMKESAKILADYKKLSGL